tara:strand:+ start:62 stop:442 length:381 start_codon:yes stop_codon:yes gene_type:complete
MKLTRELLEQIISEEILPEGVYRINTDIDADFRGNMVQLISSTGRLPLDKQSLRVLLTLVRQHVSRTLESIEPMLEGARFSLPNGIRIELDRFKGITLSHSKGKVVLDRKDLSTFLKQMKKQMGIA